MYFTVLPVQHKNSCYCFSFDSEVSIFRLKAMPIFLLSVFRMLRSLMSNQHLLLLQGNSRSRSLKDVKVICVSNKLQLVYGIFQYLSHYYDYI